VDNELLSVNSLALRVPDLQDFLVIKMEQGSVKTIDTRSQRLERHGSSLANPCARIVAKCLQRGKGGPWSSSRWNPVISGELARSP